jgi:hypothetical protein
MQTAHVELVAAATKTAIADPVPAIPLRVGVIIARAPCQLSRAMSG